MSSNHPLQKIIRSDEPTRLSIGNFQLTRISGGTYWIDGGTLFGVVPRVLWEKHYQPDERHRILQETNCLLVERSGRKILIETGYGSKLPEKFCKHHRISLPAPLTENLNKVGVQAEEIDLVVLTHLHFDHAGGCTSRDDAGNLVPTFPNATYIVNETEWETAQNAGPELKGAYDPENFSLLQQSNLLRLVRDGEEIEQGLKVWQTGGHTAGHQSVIIEDGTEGAIFAGDVCATLAHQSMVWCMAYDTNLLETRRNKVRLLDLAERNNWWVIFDHDPYCFAVKRGEDA